MVKKDPVEKKPVRKPRVKKVVKLSNEPEDELDQPHDNSNELHKSPCKEESIVVSVQNITDEPKIQAIEQKNPDLDFKTSLTKQIITKSWADATEESIAHGTSFDTHFSSNKVVGTINDTKETNRKDDENNKEYITENHCNDNDENHFEEFNVSDHELNKITSYNDESFFDDIKAIENNSKLVKDCNEKELLEVLWKRGKDNLNIALRMQVVKLYRMLNGEKLHKDKPYKEYSSKQNKNSKDYKSKGKFRKDDFPLRYQKDYDNTPQYNSSIVEDNDDNTKGRWNRKRPPYHGRNLDQLAKNT